LAGTILTEFKRRLQTLELQPSDGGCFEVTIDGELVYSKLATGEFPQEQAIVREIRKLLK